MNGKEGLSHLQSYLRDTITQNFPLKDTLAKEYIGYLSIGNINYIWVLIFMFSPKPMSPLFTFLVNEPILQPVFLA